MKLRRLWIPTLLLSWLAPASGQGLEALDMSRADGDFVLRVAFASAVRLSSAPPTAPGKLFQLSVERIGPPEAAGVVAEERRYLPPADGAPEMSVSVHAGLAAGSRTLDLQVEIGRAHV